jgi:putative endonuclease
VTERASEPGRGRGAHNRRLGIDGEDVVAAWYEAAGFRIVARNWRCRDGELDLVAARGDTLVFCEVKTRTSTAFGHPFEAVTPRKQQRIRRLATLFLAQRQGGGYFEHLRFDVAAVMNREVEVLEGAF